MWRVYRLTRGILNAESDPGERLQVRTKSHPKEKVHVRRLPFELCLSQSCPTVTCPTTSEAPALTRYHIPASASLYKLSGCVTLQSNSSYFYLAHKVLLKTVFVNLTKRPNCHRISKNFNWQKKKKKGK